MRNKKKGYGYLLLLTVLLTVAAILTLIPHAAASKECMLGYKSVCSFTPVSTLILVIAAGVTCVVRKRRSC